MRSVLSSGLLLLALWSSTALGKATLPSWQALEFEYTAFWATARSEVSVLPDTNNDGQWHLTANNSVRSAFSGNAEKKQMVFAPESGQLKQRSRYSQGSSERFKYYDYLSEHITRERRDPQEGQSALTSEPTEWPLSSRSQISYPALQNEEVVTDAYALLPLASSFNASEESQRSYVVQTDYNFYRVKMTRSIDTTVNAHYVVQGSDGDKKTINGPRKVSSVTLRVSPAGTLAEEPDFELMGLHGRLILLFDKQTGVPLQMRGTAPRIGATEIDLKKVVMRDAPQ